MCGNQRKLCLAATHLVVDDTTGNAPAFRAISNVIRQALYCTNEPAIPQ
jgi:hypothetical protein